MVDGVLLLVDACEGPLPQTRFVLKKALDRARADGLHQQDRPPRRAPCRGARRGLRSVHRSGADEDQLDFPVLYTNARKGTALTQPASTASDLKPLFETIISHLPGPEVDPDATLQFQANNLEYDEYVGRLAIGRIVAGSMDSGASYSLCRLDGSRIVCKIAHIYGMARAQADRSRSRRAGDIVTVAGLEDIEIGETIGDAGESAAAARDPDRRAHRGDDVFRQQFAVGGTRGPVRNLAQAAASASNWSRAATSASGSRRSAPITGTWSAAANCSSR